MEENKVRTSLKAVPYRQIYQAMRREGGHQHWWPGETPFEVMVGAILTQNTAWANVEKAIHNLKQAKVLTPWKLGRMPLAKLRSLIRPSGFFNVKARRLREFLKFFREKYSNSIRKMKRKKTDVLRNELLTVKGIGRETADSILLYALGKPIFVVDAYTRRIFSRHALVQAGADYDQIRRGFESHLPRFRALFNDYHAQIVRIGKNYCRKTPDCTHCPLQFLFEPR